MLHNKRVFLSEPDKVLSLSFKQQQQIFVYVISRQSELKLLRMSYYSFERDFALRIPLIITCCALLLFLLIRIWKECLCGAPIRIVLQEDSRTVKDARIVQYEERNHTVKV